jgi:hypothetical protein
MKKRTLVIGLCAFILAAGTSAFTAKKEAALSPLIWFDPNVSYQFQYFGTVPDAMTNIGGYPYPGTLVISEGFYYWRDTNPYNSNPFATIVYGPLSGNPSYGTELKLDDDGYPMLYTDERLWE